MTSLRLQNHVLSGLLLALGGCPEPEDRVFGESFSAGLEAGDGFADAECGNGLVEDGEQCDLGDLQAATGECTPDCQINVCGDGYVSADSEDCDDQNYDQHDGCLADCTANVCGDGIVHAGVEACDDGNADDADACRSDCTLGSCGDAQVQSGEQCDDGNDDLADGCVGCQFAYCGDAQVWADHEQCDDGNEHDDDACLGTCVAASCGDGIVWTGVELCDDGNLDDGDACPSSCAPAACGDGFVFAGTETCDDGNHVSDDGCDSQCVAEFCLRVVNGPAEDLSGNSWFDACVATPGDLVVVKLEDESGVILYAAQGKLVGDWTATEVTSTGPANVEYNENSHDRLVSLDNGDKLFIAGQDADAGTYTCNTDLGNGYGIVVYPEKPNWYYNPKIVVMPHDGAFGFMPRQFGNWGPEYEIAYADGATMNACTAGVGGLVPFKGEFTLRVKPQ